MLTKKTSPEMLTNSYKEVKDFVFAKLCRSGSPLERTKIAQEIEGLKKVIASVDYETLKIILSVDKFENLSDNDWERMSRDFEIEFDVERHLLAQYLATTNKV